MISTTLKVVDEFIPVQAQVAVFFVVRKIKDTCASMLHIAEFIFCGAKARSVRLAASTAVRSRVREMLNLTGAKPGRLLVIQAF